MNLPTRLILATGLSSLMGLTLLPTAYAQDMGAPKDAPRMLQLDDMGGQRPDGDHRGGRRGDRGGITGLMCSTDGAAQLETRLSGLATRLKLTAEQQPLFDAYKTATLTAQTTFADACAKLRPADAKPDALTALGDRQARQTAALEALNAVLPSFEALFNSLDDTQKAALIPLVGSFGDHGPRGYDRDDREDDRHDDRDDDDRGRKGRHDGRHSMIQPSAIAISALTAG